MSTSQSTPDHLPVWHTLTAQSVPVEKDTAVVAESHAIGDRLWMAYSGTVVRFGQARGLAVANFGVFECEIARGSSLELARMAAVNMLMRRLNGTF